MTVSQEPPTPPVLLDSNRCLLFAYGQLQPDRRPPRTMSRVWPDRVRGDLFDLGSYPAAVKIGASDRWIHGYVMEIAEAELVSQLDPYEEVHRGLYRRIRAVTEAGFEVWIYEYARPLPPSAVGPIDRWPRIRNTNDQDPTQRLSAPG